MENMIMAVKAPGFLYGQKISRLLNHTDQRPIPSRISADNTGLFLRKGKTAGTKLDGIV
jgi:hypothetical protein